MPAFRGRTTKQQPRCTLWWSVVKCWNELPNCKSWWLSNQSFGVSTPLSPSHSRSRPPVLSLPVAPFQAFSPPRWTESFTFPLRIYIPVSIYYRLTASHPFSTPSSLRLTPPSTTASPRRPANQASSRAGPHDLSRELAKSTGPGPEQRSWAAHAQISPPQSGAGAPLLPGLQLEERRLEREGGADWDTRDSKSRF